MKKTLILAAIFALHAVKLTGATVYFEDEFPGPGIDAGKWLQRVDWTGSAPPYPSNNGQDIVGGRLHQYAKGHAVELLSQDTFSVAGLHVHFDLEKPAAEESTPYTSIELGDSGSAYNVWFANFRNGVCSISANVYSSSDHLHIGDLRYANDKVIHFDAWTNDTKDETTIQLIEEGGTTQSITFSHYNSATAQHLYMWS